MLFEDSSYPPVRVHHGSSIWWVDHYGNLPSGLRPPSKDVVLEDTETRICLCCSLDLCQSGYWIHVDLRQFLVSHEQVVPVSSCVHICDTESYCNTDDLDLVLGLDLDCHFFGPGSQRTTMWSLVSARAINVLTSALGRHTHAVWTRPHCNHFPSQRGKFRPTLSKLVASNSDGDVVSASTKAFRALPDLKAAVEALTVLKGVGPATASGVCVCLCVSVCVCVCAFVNGCVAGHLGAANDLKTSSIHVCICPHFGI